MMTPARRAQEDFRAGCGQDDNPYKLATHPEEYRAWAWEMHRLWAEDFSAEQAAGRAIAHQQGNAEENL